MERLAASVRDFASENPRADYDAIVARFGTPKQFVITYLGEMDSSEVLETIQIKRKIVRIVLSVAVAVILLWGSVVAIALLDSVNQSGGHGIVTIVEG